MPFIDIEPAEHSCRLPGRTVGFGTTWYCNLCLLVYRWEECEGHEQNHQIVFHDGHWNPTGGVFEHRIVPLLD